MHNDLPQSGAHTFPLYSSMGWNPSPKLCSNRITYKKRFRKKPPIPTEETTQHPPPPRPGPARARAYTQDDGIFRPPALRWGLVAVDSPLGLGTGQSGSSASWWGREGRPRPRACSCMRPPAQPNPTPPRPKALPKKNPILNKKPLNLTKASRPLVIKKTGLLSSTKPPTPYQKKPQATQLFGQPCRTLQPHIIEQQIQGTKASKDDAAVLPPVPKGLSGCVPWVGGWAGGGGGGGGGGQHVYGE